MDRSKSVAYPTVGEIARRLEVPVHRVEYVVRTRQIDPIGMAGNARVFGAEDVRRIAGELSRIDEHERGRKEGEWS